MTYLAQVLGAFCLTLGLLAAAMGVRGVRETFSRRVDGRVADLRRRMDQA